MSLRKIGIAILLAGLAVSSFAQNGPMEPNEQGMNAPGGGDRGERQHQGPPPQAIAACQGKTSGAPCSFVGRRNNQLTGTCFTPPPRPGKAEPPMACRPERDGHGGGEPRQ